MLKIKQTNRVILIDTSTNWVEEFTNLDVLGEHIGIPVMTLKNWFRKHPVTKQKPTIVRYKQYEIRKIKHVYVRDHNFKS